MRSRVGRCLVAAIMENRTGEARCFDAGDNGALTELRLALWGLVLEDLKEPVAKLSRLRHDFLE
jgi:hypothetical protein